MSFLRKNWYYVGGGLCVALAIALACLWSDIDPLRKILGISFMALLVHQFEEYAWPGGFPAVMNIAWMPAGEETADHFPLNRSNALLVNVFFAYPYYILPIIFPQLIWMGIGQVAFGVGQLVVHGFVINRKLRSVYNPGLFAVVVLHLPIAACYAWYVIANHLVAWWNWPISVAWLAFGMICGVGLPVMRLSDKNSPYPFSEKEMARFHVREKLAK